MIDMDKLVDIEKSTQSKQVFWDQDIYDLELERIFGRCWLFLAHESQLEKPGDFFTTKMGEDSVILSGIQMGH